MFLVDDVVPAAELLPTQRIATLYPEAIAAGVDSDRMVLAADGVHPVISAVARAFADHRPLVLSPDAIWLTITQGLAQHIRLHAEELRLRLVRSSGRMPISITVDGSEAWPELVEQFSKLVAHDADGTDLFVCDFTTSSPVERVASQIVLLDAYSPYFSFWLVGICGIPAITLTGTIDDWQKIRDRVGLLGVFGVEHWQKSLTPIAEQFVRAASGDVDTEFWKRIYNPKDAYGGEVATGWITRLYPYLKAQGVQDYPNPLLDLPIDEPQGLTDSESRSYSGPGIRTDHVPATLSSAQINIVGAGVTTPNRTTLHGGLVAVAQNADGALEPIAGWYVTGSRVPIDEIIERIRTEHITTPPQEIRFLEGSAETVALYRHVGSATMFDGEWRLPNYSERGCIYRSPGLRRIDPLIALSGDRWLSAACNRGDDVAWVICRIERSPRDVQANGLSISPGWTCKLLDDPTKIPTFGDSLALILDAALDNNGDIGHLQTGWLTSLDAVDLATHHRRVAEYQAKNPRPTPQQPS